MHVLLVEDDATMAAATRSGLVQAGFAVDAVPDAEQALRWLSTEHFDLALVDIGLPGVDGLSLVRSLRASGNAIPILMLTARDELGDRVDAFGRGADDYVIKPFELQELIVRCRALIRRAHGISNDRIRFGELQLDFAGRRAQSRGADIRLTPREWAVLECLALNAGKLVRKERLLQAIANYDEEVSERVIEVYVSRLRTKLGNAVTLTGARGLGYRLDEPLR